MADIVLQGKIPGAEHYSTRLTQDLMGMAEEAAETAERAGMRLGEVQIRVLLVDLQPARVLLLRFLKIGRMLFPLS
jgi:hypothetical protein